MSDEKGAKPGRRRPPGFEAHPERINRKGRPRTGQSLAELARQFLKEDIDVKVKGEGGKVELTRVNRTRLFLEAVYNRATRGSDAAARLLWNYIDGLPPFTGRLGALPDEGGEVDPADEEAIREHLRALIMGKGRNGNGNGSEKQ